MDSKKRITYGEEAGGNIGGEAQWLEGRRSKSGDGGTLMRPSEGKGLEFERKNPRRRRDAMHSCRNPITSTVPFSLIYKNLQEEEKPKEHWISYPL